LPVQDEGYVEVARSYGGWPTHADITLKYHGGRPVIERLIGRSRFAPLSSTNKLPRVAGGTGV
jgi:hypothetical protein